MAMSTGVGTVQFPPAKNLLSILTDILGEYMGQADVDGVIQGTGNGGHIPPLVMEYKQALGEGDCDPMTQGSYSALNCWQDDDVSAVGL